MNEQSLYAIIEKTLITNLPNGAIVLGAAEQQGIRSEIFDKLLESHNFQIIDTLTGSAKSLKWAEIEKLIKLRDVWVIYSVLHSAGSNVDFSPLFPEIFQVLQSTLAGEKNARGRKPVKQPGTDNKGTCLIILNELLGKSKKLSQEQLNDIYGLCAKYQLLLFIDPIMKDFKTKFFGRSNLAADILQLYCHDGAVVRAALLAGSQITAAGLRTASSKQFAHELRILSINPGDTSAKSIYQALLQQKDINDDILEEFVLNNIGVPFSPIKDEVLGNLAEQFYHKLPSPHEHNLISLLRQIDNQKNVTGANWFRALLLVRKYENSLSESSRKHIKRYLELNLKKFWDSNAGRKLLQKHNLSFTLLSDSSQTANVRKQLLEKIIKDHLSAENKAIQLS